MKQKCYSRLSPCNVVRYALSCDKLLQKLTSSDSLPDDLKEDGKQITSQARAKKQKDQIFERCV